MEDEGEFHRRPENVEVGKYLFSSNFDSGNGWRFDKRDDEFVLYTIPDCEGTQHKTGYKTWFHFSVKGGSKGETINFCIGGLNAQSKLYGRDMRPVVRSYPSQQQYERIRSGAAYEQDEEKTKVKIRFKHKFEFDSEEVFFAFTYPYGYTELQERLSQLDKAFASHRTIYYQRELASHSLEGRRMDLLTITNRMSSLQVATADSTVRCEEPIEGLFPEGKPRPLEFEKRPVIFISARVHPGEVPAQWVFDGFLDFALGSDPRSEALRDNFVIKMVPMLNPDGVFRGCYRSDTAGQNLNRFYGEPDEKQQPTIFAAKEIMMQLVRRNVLSNYIDLHAHATRRGCFLYGNAIPDVEQQIENVLYARLVALNTPHLDFDGCNFTERNMRAKDKRDGLSKEGSGRVAMFKETGLVHSYVLECNYNTGRLVNTVPQASTDDPRCSPGRIADKKGPPKYTPEIYKNVGKALAVAILDQRQLNPWSRLPNSHAQTLDNLRTWVTSCVAGASKTYRQEIKEKGLDTMSTRKKTVLPKEVESSAPPKRQQVAVKTQRAAPLGPRNTKEDAKDDSVKTQDGGKSSDQANTSSVQSSSAPSTSTSVANISSRKKHQEKEKEKDGPQHESDESADDSGAASDDDGCGDVTATRQSRNRKDLPMRKQLLEEALRGGCAVVSTRTASSDVSDSAQGGRQFSRIAMTGKAVDRARSIADRRQRQDLHNARRRVVYVADRSGDNGPPMGMVGRCVSVQPTHGTAAREELVTRVVAPQMNFGMGVLRHAPSGAEESKVSGRAGRILPNCKDSKDTKGIDAPLKAERPLRLKSSHAPRRRRLGQGLGVKLTTGAVREAGILQGTNPAEPSMHGDQTQGRRQTWSGGE